LNLVPGIEISCQYKGKNFHLLGYGIHAEDPVFAAIEKDVYGQRRAISEKVPRRRRSPGHRPRPAGYLEALQRRCRCVRPYRPRRPGGPAQCGLSRPGTVPAGWGAERCAIRQLWLGYLRPGRPGFRAHDLHGFCQSRRHHPRPRRCRRPWPIPVPI
jgi:hypothetical protein